jgi:hypothetical protein
MGIGFDDFWTIGTHPFPKNINTQIFLAFFAHSELCHKKSDHKNHSAKNK